ncbi:MAG: bifunctional diaminohydroxyphosphoribosylaminopyrimidine deaminase/5-amino-6-(5-phosphoribosylamino)uracil reductase RibD [Hyphomicrobiaceae bacterium]|nr:bifunctional diaminohydroxyphosphoribosylaminopyrimidine deaminase/5-amino-6-(5-phosphoribosylamino)uracil reductase RibD [Hyphomicrobiaceae bacterium]
MPHHDEAYMRAAFALARRTLGRTAPNPAVGALIVRPDGSRDELVACGWTMHGGRPHAERVALERAGEAARGATLYVTLEPCAHHAKTPPCADAIIEAGISRVVVSAGDPDPRVAGKGISKLNDAGIEVEEGCLEEEGAALARGHILRVRENRPLVQLKLAVGSDGLVPQGREGAPVWVTGSDARAHGHLLRARADAILAGHGTITADDPSLTCRLPGMVEDSPVRVVLCSALDIPATAKLFADIETAPVWAVGSLKADTAREKTLAGAGAEIIRAEVNEGGGLDIRDVLSALAARGITRLLVEGGPHVASSFWNAGLVDEIYIYKGPEPAGGNGLPALAGEQLSAIETSGDFMRESTRELGHDTLDVYRRKNG